MRPRHHLPVKLLDGRRLVWSLGGLGALAALPGVGAVGFFGCALAVELLAKLTHLVRR